ncbi:NAD(P)H:quinone oxidoreductase [Paracoccus sp. M683]|uniref:NAD(P)H:quinone oxidoreductase n=1 Tax=Paracoccus sp. M683 TaxID=2594268 RepID=UPI00117C4C8E|nr:NAD(P)H:quinone oxidoreductase [Paracoccus sp. M683]TRW95292.1 NAD(P)H:quinone oxidoreductase [Paracoccus sp. M683]
MIRLIPEAKDVRTLVLFHSRTGNTRLLAEAVAEGARIGGGASVALRHLPELGDQDALLAHDYVGPKYAAVRASCPTAAIQDIAAADVVILGCPTRMGGMTAEMKALIDELGGVWQSGAFQDKVGACFTTASTPHGGQEMTLIGMSVAMIHLGMILAAPGYTARITENAGSPYGATATSKHFGQRVGPTSDDLQAARALGRRAALVGRDLLRGRAAAEHPLPGQQTTG